MPSCHLSGGGPGRNLNRRPSRQSARHQTSITAPTQLALILCANFCRNFATFGATTNEQYP